VIFGTLSRSRGWVRAAGVLMTLPLVVLSACDEASTRSATPVPTPGRVESLNGSETKKVILSERAAAQIRLETVGVSPATATRGRAARSAVPYSALVYRPDGTAIVYTNPAPLVYVAQAVTVESMQGDSVTLAVGPRPGIRVVSVGAPELLGIELSVGK
jgi:hypothetical protein